MTQLVYLGPSLYITKPRPSWPSPAFCFQPAEWLSDQGNSRSHAHSQVYPQEILRYNFGIIILKVIIGADNLFIFVHPVYRLIVAIAKLQPLRLISAVAPRSLHPSLKAPQSLQHVCHKRVCPLNQIPKPKPLKFDTTEYDSVSWIISGCVDLAFFKNVRNIKTLYPVLPVGNSEWSAVPVLSQLVANTLKPVSLPKIWDSPIVQAVAQLTLLRGAQSKHEGPCLKFASGSQMYQAKRIKD